MTKPTVSSQYSVTYVAKNKSHVLPVECLTKICDNYFFCVLVIKIIRDKRFPYKIRGRLTRIARDKYLSRALRYQKIRNEINKLVIIINVIKETRFKIEQWSLLKTYFHL